MILLRRNRSFFIVVILLTGLAVFCSSQTNADQAVPAPADSASVISSYNLEEPLTVEQCIAIALQQNQARQASEFSVKVAEAQLQQAISGFRPTAVLKSALSITDKDQNFIFPATDFTIPGMTIPLPPPMGPVVLPESTITVPEQNIKILPRQNIYSTLEFTYPLNTGGLLEAIHKQAESGVEIAQAEAKKTDLEIICKVKRHYYAVILSRQLLNIANDSLERMEVTLELTKGLYEAGSERVNKLDYLRNQMAVDWLQSMVATLEGNEKLANAALLNALGLDWSTRINLAETELPDELPAGELNNLIDAAYLSNPDWAKLQAGLAATEAGIDKAKSEERPKFAITGSLTHIDSTYDKGFVTPDNKNRAAINLGMELPIFTGSRTKHQIEEAKSRLDALEAQQVLLREGIALQVQYLFFQITSAQEAAQALHSAVVTSGENVDLQERAYQQGMTDAEDVIQAQIMDALIQAQYAKTRYDVIEQKAQLDSVIGTEMDMLAAKPGREGSENK